MEEILKKENNRDKDTFRKIYFYKNGNSPWYRAYELSAYYATFYNNGLEDKDRLNPQRKTSKFDESGIIQVGLQLTSFKKYFPDVIVSDISGDCIVIDAPDNDFIDIVLDNYLDVLSEWKNSMELHTKADKKKETKPIKTVYNSPVSFTEIMRQILRYDTHNRNETDLRNFVCTLKEMCANLI